MERPVTEWGNTGESPRNTEFKNSIWGTWNLKGLLRHSRGHVHCLINEARYLKSVSCKTHSRNEYYYDGLEYHNYFFVLMWTVFFLKSSLNLLQYCFYSLCFGFFGGKACGILVPWPKLELPTPALEGKVLTTLDLQGSPCNLTFKPDACFFLSLPFVLHSSFLPF